MTRGRETPAEPDGRSLSLAEGCEVGEHRLVRRLGSGGFGEVWLAEHRWLPGRRAALKVPRDARAVEQLRRDGVLQARLDAPEIVRVIGMDLDREPPFVAYELVDGPTLASRLPLGAAPALDLLADVAAALAHAHARSVLHLDLKPANILIDPTGRARVTDFGLGFPLAADPSHLAPSGGLATGDPLGTVAYMGPEQRAVGPLDPRADIFAFGVVLFETLTGRLPAAAERPRDIVPSLPAPIDDLYLRCCSPLDRRIADGTALLAALRSARGALATATPAPIAWRDRLAPASARAWRDRSRP